MTVKNRSYSQLIDKETAQEVNQLALEKERYRLLFENTHDAVILLDEQQITSCNQRALQIFSVTEQEMLGKSLLALSPLLQPDDLYSEDMFNLYCLRVQKKEPQNFEWRFKRSSNLGFDAEVNLNGLTLNGKTIYQALIRDVSERRQHLSELYRQAHYDELTTLPNRHKTIQTINSLIENMNITGGNFSVFMIDVCRLQHINDTLGHSRGDELLQKFSSRLLPLCTFKNALSRFVGNQFMLLVTAIPSEDQLNRIARQILKLLDEPFTIAGMDIFISANIGVCSYPKDGTTVEALLKNVEAALHRTKRQNHSSVQIYNQELSNLSQERLTLENRLHRALERNEFELFFQPQIDLTTETVAGAEVLLRWKSPAEGLVSPLRFIPVLEETGLIIQVGRWVIRQACRQMREWLDLGLPSLDISVNVSALQFHRGHLVDTVRSALLDYGIDPRLLCLEVTESLIMDDVETTIQVMEQLVELGVLLSIDDFGTGYSSLSYLRRMPIHEVKIDRSFIINVPHESSANTMVETIMGMAACLNLRVVAEGVETKEQHDYLAARQCSRIQGFYYAKPVPALEFTSLIETGSCIKNATLG